MKRERNNTLKLGVFVILGVLMLVTAIYIIGRRKNYFGETYTIHAVFSNVKGLVSGNNVRFSGINVGTVESIEIINDSSVDVTFLIREEVCQFIHLDAKAEIVSDGLMGSKVINIFAGTPGSETLYDGATITGVLPMGMEDVLEPLRRTAENASVITHNLSMITNKLANGEGPIGRLFMDKRMGDELSNTLSNLRNASEGLDENMEAAKNSFLLKGYFKKKEREKEKLERQKMIENGLLPAEEEKKKGIFKFLKKNKKEGEKTEAVEEKEKVKE